MGHLLLLETYLKLGLSLFVPFPLLRVLIIMSAVLNGGPCRHPSSQVVRQQLFI